MAGPEQHPHPIPNAALDAFDLGSREYVTGQNDKALDHFEQAIALHDDYADALYMRGLTLLRLGRRDDGLASLQRAADTTGNHILKDYALKKIKAVA
jgi:tetratricopeptide (TPR) repeat protein